MKITRLRIEEFRRFRAPFEVSGLDDGINLFVGHNEAGKSTIAAALRAAFLERTRTRTVTDFAPWGSSGARPGVEVDFTIGTREYRLSKYFLTRSRCELVITESGQAGQTQRLEGESAEDALAQLLGFEFPGKGQSQAKQAGVPGLLWIQQGDAQELSEVAQFAGQHLRDALTTLSGELASAEGDRLYARVQEARHELLDARAGRPKGPWREAEEALQAAQSTLQQRQTEKAALDADVDHLALLRVEYAAQAAQQAWQGFDAEAALARARLEELGKAREHAVGLQQALTQAEAMLQSVQTQVRRDQEDEDNLREQQHTTEKLLAEASDAQAALALAQRTQARCLSELAQAQARHRALSVRDELHDIATQRTQWLTEAERLEAAMQQASRLQNECDLLDGRLRESADLQPDDLRALQVVEQQLLQARIRQEAAATRLRFALAPGQTLAMQETALPATLLRGDGECWLSAQATIDIDGVGRLEILPGGTDLPQLADDMLARQKERQRLLARLGATSLEAAQTRWSEREQLTIQHNSARKTLLIYAPDGMAGLQRASAAGQARDSALLARHGTLQNELAQLDGAQASNLSDKHNPLHTAEAVQAVREAESACQRAADVQHAAEAHFQNVAARARLLEEQLAHRMAVFHAPAHAADREARTGRLAEARAAATALQRRSEAALAALAAQRPGIIEQDLIRFERSAQLARDAHQARHHDILTLSGRLEQANAQGVGEAVLGAQADVERLQRRRDDIVRRANGLDLLMNLLGEQRDAATQRLQLPLAQRLNHYLALLFPASGLTLDDNLLPLALQRATQEDAIQQLSFGTREQLGLLVRLAYADLLQAAGRPTLLVLDDVLVHADASRRALMKRALFDAAQRHQILMLTCHAEVWQDLGVAQRRIGV